MYKYKLDFFNIAVYILKVFPFYFSIYEKLIDYIGIDEKGTNYPPVSDKQYN